MSESTAFDSEKLKECAGWLQDCTAIFNGPNLWQPEIAVYLKAVCCPDPDKVIEALKHWLLNERRFPWPVDIRQVIEQIIEQEAGDKEYIALESTPFDRGKHRECVHRLRYIAHLYDAPHLSDPDIAAYFNAVNCTDADKVHQALVGWIGRGWGFPSPEDIRSCIRKLDEDKARPENEDEISPVGRILRAQPPRQRSPASGILKASLAECGIANSEGLHPHAVHGAGAHQAAAGSSEKSTEAHHLDRDASQ